MLLLRLDRNKPSISDSRCSSSRQSIEVNSEAPILNPENANTSTTLNAHALEDLPNPGGDLTYPLQFAAGALVNTAGSGNDFVGGTNGYGNVEFNGLPRFRMATSSMDWKQTTR